MELIPVILKSSENQPSRTYKSNLAQIWHPIFPFQFFKGFLSRASKICSKRYIDQEIELLIDVFTENGYERKNLGKKSKNYLNEPQNPPLTKRVNSEDINKIAKLP